MLATGPYIYLGVYSRHEHIKFPLDDLLKLLLLSAAEFILLSSAESTIGGHPMARFLKMYPEVSQHLESLTEEEFEMDLAKMDLMDCEGLSRWLSRGFGPLDHAYTELPHQMATHNDSAHTRGDNENYSYDDTRLNFSTPSYRQDMIPDWGSGRQVPPIK